MKINVNLYESSCDFVSLNIFTDYTFLAMSKCRPILRYCKKRVGSFGQLLCQSFLLRKKERGREKDNFAAIDLQKKKRKKVSFEFKHFLLSFSFLSTAFTTLAPADAKIRRQMFKIGLLAKLTD